MSEESKKVKALAKPIKATKKTVAEKPAAKKAATKKATVKTESNAAAKAAPEKHVKHEEIVALAERFWAERGYQDGHHLEDWHRAERELHGKTS